MRRWAALLVLTLATLHIAANSLWLSRDEGVQYTDAAFHYSQVAERHHALQVGAAALEEHSQADENQRYGSFYYLVATAVSLLTGPRPGALLTGLSLLLWPMLLFGAFRLGFELGHPDRRQSTGLLTAAIASLLPGLFNYSRVLVLDLPVTVAVCWSMALLLQGMREGEEQRRRRVWLGAGLAAALGLGIKINVLAFLAGPLWVVLSPSLARAWREDRRRFGKGAAAVVGLGALLAGWLLLGSRSKAIVETLRDSTWPGKLIGYAADGALRDYPGHYLAALRSHSWEIVYYTTLQSFTPALLLVTLGAVLWFFARKRGCVEPSARVQRDLVFWALAIPFFGVVFVLRDIYDERYLLPLLPLCAALVAIAVLDIRKRGLRRGAVLALLLGGALNFAAISFDALPGLRPLACTSISGWAPESRVGSGLWLCALYPNYSFMDRASTPTTGGSDAPLAGQNADHVLARMESILRPSRAEIGRPLRVVFLDDLYGLFYRTFDRALSASDQAGDDRAALFRQEDLLLLSKCTDRRWLTAMFESIEGVEATIDAADVVIMRSGTPDASPDSGLRGRRCLVFWSQQHNWRQMGTIDLVDGTSVEMYQRRPR
jgi:hypothetical protein